MKNLTTVTPREEIKIAVDGLPGWTLNGTSALYQGKPKASIHWIETERQWRLTFSTPQSVQSGRKFFSTHAAALVVFVMGQQIPFTACELCLECRTVELDHTPWNEHLCTCDPKGKCPAYLDCESDRVHNRSMDV